MPRRAKKVAGPADPPSQPAANQRVTLRTLAEHLRLSRTTVSIILNDTPLARTFPPETRDRVLDMARTLGYRPNYFARSLTSRRTYLIGVIAPDFGNGYDAALLSGVERRLLTTDYTYFVSSHLWSSALLERNVQMLRDRGAEGLLLINTTLAEAVDIPIVTICSNRSPGSSTRISIDNGAGIKRALEYLVGLGHRKIAFFKGHEGSGDTEERWNAVLANCAKLGIAVTPELTVQLERLDATATRSVEEGRVAMEVLIRRGLPFTALLAFNDLSAFGAMSGLRKAGRRVPEDVSVMGFDDIEFSSIVDPPLTTVRQPLHDMGGKAADLLVRKIEGNASTVKNLQIRPQLIVRDSTCPPPAASRKKATKA